MSNLFVWKNFVEALPFLLTGVKVTITITILAVVIGIILGTLLGLAKLSNTKIFRLVATVYIDIVRGTPLLVQIFIVYLIFPPLFGFNSSDFYRYVAAVLAMGLNSGAYVAEIVRAGIQAIDKGQMEAARSLGMSHAKAMRYIILPQAFKQILPPLGNEFIILLKDSSLASTISVQEMFKNGQDIYNRNWAVVEVLIGVAIIYFIMTFTFSRILAIVERRLKTSD